ncbi:MAG: two-component regulator propeller domain-containing protein [Bacteroidota bacterium]
MAGTFLKAFSLLSIIFSCGAAYSQDRPIGAWKSFLPYANSVGVGTDGFNIITITSEAFFTYRPSDGDLDAYSKVEGMSDIGMQCVAVDQTTGMAVLVYTNGNIDLFKDNTFYNIPDLKIKVITGSKTVFSAYAANGKAYLSSALGVIVLDLTAHEVDETYQFMENSQVVPVRSFTARGDHFYAVTAKGLYRAPKNSPALQNFQTWTKLTPADSLTNIVSVGSGLYLSAPRTVFSLVADTLQKIYTTQGRVQHIDAGKTALLISEYNDSTAKGVVRIMEGTTITDTFEVKGRPVQAVQMEDNSIVVASPGNPMQKRTNGVMGYYTPEGPSDVNTFDVYAYNKDVFIAHGGYNELFFAHFNYNGVSNIKDNKWKYLKEGSVTSLYRVRDVSSVLRDESDGTLYLGSFMDGITIIKKDGTEENINKNSILDQSAAYGDDARQTLGLALDSRRNLWFGSAFASHQLYARSQDGQLYKYFLPGAGYGGQVVVDKNDQVWFINSYTGGLTVFDANGTLGDLSDDTFYDFGTGAGFGNLPSNNVLSIARDKNNNIWVGTANGIGIVNHCSSPFEGQAPCDADRPIVQYDQFAGYLFEGNSVRSIAVDGANRKWVGTDDGVWLLSADAGKIVYRFTVDNSPLPSNKVQKISVDEVTGDVYIGTDRGLVSYRSTATEGGTTNNAVTTFPNPVPAGYTGTIAIKGLVANADVRITDIDGHMVYRTKALGGQAIWSGVDYTGHRPQSGVYLIFVSNNDGTETYSGKMVFLQ